MSTPIRRRYRAPQEDGAALIDPPLAHIASLIQANRERELPAFAIAARSSLLSHALAYTSQYRDVGFAPTVTHDTPFILAGHQPELFHAGVWFKNFLLSSIARKSGGIGINLIIDNDAIRATSIRVPTTSADEVVRIPFDRGSLDTPYEDRAVGDRPTFLQFAERVQQIAKPSRDRDASLLVARLWPEVVAAARPAFENLGRALAEGRHRLEGAFDLHTLEIPLSQVCNPAESPPFSRFVSELLAQAQQFHTTYNACVREYRLANHIRGDAHPVPDLESANGWLELPFWVWTQADPRRRRLFVAVRQSMLELSDHSHWRRGLRLAGDHWTARAAAALSSIELEGIKLRPRALITTMYARLVLSDLFIHGIGGAKYDEVTDAIIRRFFGIEPPKYITATATFRLPIERPHVTADDVRASARLLRDVRYRPEGLLSHPLLKSETAMRGQLESLAAEKREYLARYNPRRNAAEVFAGLDRINRAMHALLAPVERELQAAHARLIDDARKSALLGSREFSFVLFSEELPARLLALCQGVA